MTIADVFSEFDVLDKKGFEAHDIIGALSAVEEKEKIEPEYGYEYLAFYLLPNSENNSTWGTFYGPHSIFTDAENNIIESPALRDITIDAVLYWEQRYKTTQNPLLTMRYCSLVWDFKSRLFHQKNESDLYRTYVDSMLKVCNEDYARHPIITINILERLFSIAKNQEDDLQIIKKAYIDFETRHSKDRSAKIWSSRFSLMVENQGYFTEEEITKLVDEHEQRLSRMCNPSDGKVNPWNIEHQATLLARYYHSINHINDIKRVLHCVENAFLQIADSLSSLQLMGNLENLHKEYKHYSLHEEAKKLTVEIQRLGAAVKQELKPIQTKITIPREILDHIEESVGEGVDSADERWTSFVFSFIPDIQQLQDELCNLSKKHALSFLIPRRHLDHNGHPTTVIGPYSKDPEGQLIHRYSTILHYTDPFLNYAIEKMKSIGAITVEKIMTERISLCPIFEEERYDVIREALDLYFEGKYTLTCHLLVPQIECAIRNLMELCGVPILVLQSEKQGLGFQLRTLNSLLKEDIIKEIFSENGALYLKYVLTEPRALNIRNDLCHGFLPPQCFGKAIANRLLHVLIMLSMVRNQEKE